MDAKYIKFSAPHRLLCGLKAYWKMDETTGGTIYDSLGAFDLTVYNATINQTGKIGQSILFDANNEYLSKTTNSHLLCPGGYGYSVSFWINFTNLPSTNGYVCRILTISTYTAYSHNAIYVEASNASSIDRLKCVFYQTNLVGRTVLPTEIVNTAQWDHYVYTISTSGGKVYRNNIDITSSGTAIDAPLCPGEPTKGVTIGLSNASYLFVGYIDEFGLWNRELSADEVTELYNSGSGLSYPFT